MGWLRSLNFDLYLFQRQIRSRCIWVALQNCLLAGFSFVSEYLVLIKELTGTIGCLYAWQLYLIPVE